MKISCRKTRERESEWGCERDGEERKKRPSELGEKRPSEMDLKGVTIEYCNILYNIL